MSEWYWRGSLPLAPPSRKEVHAFGGSKSFLRLLLSSRKRNEREMKERKNRLLACQWRSAPEKGSTSELRMVAVGIGKATIGGRREADSRLIAGISKHFLAYYMRGTSHLENWGKPCLLWFVQCPGQCHSLAMSDRFARPKVRSTGHNRCWHEKIYLLPVAITVAGSYCTVQQGWGPKIKSQQNTHTNTRMHTHTLLPWQTQETLKTSQERMKLYTKPGLLEGQPVSEAYPHAKNFVQKHQLSKDLIR